jgi:hypothetical protein
MIDVAVHKRPFHYREKWFFAAPLPSDAIRLVHYKQSQDELPVRGFRREPFLTVVIDLARSDAELLKGCRKTNQNEIRRAEREGVEFFLEPNIANFFKFYTPRAGGYAVTEERLRQYGPCLRLTKATSKGSVLVAHAYLIDESICRARLLLSASQLKQNVGQEERQFVGRAHRLLIYREMLFFRDAGIRFLDLGGYAPSDADRKLLSINAFKASFGGMVVEESDYISYPLHLLRLLRQKLKIKATAHDRQ